jgi:hypothetical protein
MADLDSPAPRGLTLSAARSSSDSDELQARSGRSQLCERLPSAEVLSTYLSASDFRSPNGVALATDRNVLFKEAAIRRVMLPASGGSGR